MTEHRANDTGSLSHYYYANDYTANINGDEANSTCISFEKLSYQKITDNSRFYAL